MSASRRSAAIAWRLRSLCSKATVDRSYSSLISHSHSLRASCLDFEADDARFERREQWIDHARVHQTRAFSIFPRRGEDAIEKNDSATATDAVGSKKGKDERCDPECSADVPSTRVELEGYTPESIIDIAAEAESAAMQAATEGAWLPTRALDSLLSSVHSYSGLPWWQSIMLTTIGIRMTTLPIVLMQIKNTYRLSLARPEIENLVQHMKEEQAKGNPNAVKEYQVRVAKVWEKHGANPLKSMATIFVQAPLFIGFFAALRGLAAAKVPSLAEGGTLWFTDLTVPDPTYGLPILAGATFLLTVELGAADGMQGQAESTMRTMKNVMRALSVLIVPLTVNLPASVFMYWSASNMFSLTQTLLLKHPRIRKVLGVPDLSSLKAGSQNGGLNAAGKPVTTFARKPRPQKAPSKEVG